MDSYLRGSGLCCRHTNGRREDDRNSLEQHRAVGLAGKDIVVREMIRTIDVGMTKLAMIINFASAVYSEILRLILACLAISCRERGQRGTNKYDRGNHSM